ncbi:MAG: hypothetical protein KGL39_33765, partial [Patescibacteria group bacterium]|nr:hypothetical protein [Patescibacteria group bacterium]
FVPTGHVPPLGGPVHYLGMFAPLDIPMGRTGSLAAIDVWIDKTDEYGNHYAYAADLVDCRSYDGFSGSPCIATLNYVVWDSEAGGIPPGMVPRGPTGAPLRLGNTANLGRFCGMFTAHYDDENDDGAVSRYGVGVMLTSEYISAALTTGEMKEARRMADKADQEQKAASQPQLKNVAITEPASDDEYERFEDLVRQLVNTPKPKDEG